MQNLNAYIPMDRRLTLTRGKDLPDRCMDAVKPTPWASLLEDALSETHSRQ